jgi:hypothetical protein
MESSLTSPSGAGGAKVISVDIGVGVNCRFLSQSNPPDMYIQNRYKFKRQGAAKPTASAGLKNRLFWFDLIRYGLQALAGRRHRRTTRRD